MHISSEKPVHLVIPKERMNCSVVLMATPMLCCAPLFSLLPSPFASSSFPGALTVFYCVKWNLMSNIQPDFLNESVYHVRPGALCFLQRRNCAEQSTYPLKQTGFTISCETTGSSSFSPVTRIHQSMHKMFFLSVTEREYVQ